MAQGYGPEEAAQRMTVAEGFSVELVAAEPMVRQPVAIEFDDRGRLWAIQYLQYPNPAGLKRVKVDRYSRTSYDRVPKPPPHGPRGADRITILEDTDGDGRADTAKDFVDGLNLASGLAFGHGGVFVLNVPYLLFYPDRDRDDVPDGDPEVLLEGFGMEDAHSLANSLTWGPDGWLYGTQGSTVTAKIRGISFQQGVWRYHPVTKEFELFCEGGGNSWGLDFDRHGNLFYCTNFGGYVMLHGVQGGYYWKSFAKHGELHNPFAFGYFDHVPHEDFRGGHVSVGGIVYQGDSFPRALRGKYIAADLLGHAVYWHDVEPRGSTFRSRHGGDLLEANDTWFAPSDVTVGPDGAVYVADWHDQRMAHPDPDAEWDRTNGRIFRIQAVGAKAARHVDANSLSGDELIDRLSHPNNWHVRRARRVLAQRRDPNVWPRLRKMALQKKVGHGALEALWALHVSGGFDDTTALELLEHPDEHVRAWTVRLLGDARQVSSALGKELIERAGTDPSVVVRSQLASTAKRLAADVCLPIVERILLRSEDADDPYVPLLLWWAVEHHAVSSIDPMEALFTSADTWNSPLAREVVLPRLMRRWAAEGTDRSLLACERLLASAPDKDGQGEMVAALDQGLAGRHTKKPGPGKGSLFQDLAAVEQTNAASDARVVAVPPSLEQAVASLWEKGPSDATLVRLNARLGNAAALSRALDLALDAGTPKDVRIQMFGVLGELGGASCVDPLLGLIGAGQPDWLQTAAMGALARFDDERIAAAVLESYPSLDPPLRARARNLLFGRAAWTRLFLEAVDRGRIDPKEVDVEELRPIALHEDDGLDALVRKHWGRVGRGTPEEKLAEMRRLTNDLRAAAGDPTRGHALFKKHCATCHRLFDGGERTGPELTHANRKDRDFLLASLVDPNRVIRAEFISSVVVTTDGRVLTGLVVDETPSMITLVDAKNERTTVARSAIEELRDSSVSLMPENLLEELKPQEVRDLFSYLQK